MSERPEKVLKLEKGKGFYITQDNADMAIRARNARAAIMEGRGTPEDRQFIADRERLIKKAVEDQ